MRTIYFPAWQDRIIEDAAPMALARELARLGARRAYVIMSASLHDDADIWGGLRAAAGDRIAGVYAALPQHSPLPDVMGAARTARERGCDMVVSIGGGSCIDAAKIVQLCLGLGEFDMEAVLAARADKSRLRAATELRHIAVPTTLSGAEYTWFAGGRNPQTGLKEAFAVPGLLPRTVILDGQLATRTPQRLWLSSGLRALDHAIEGLISGRNHPLGHALAVDGLARLRQALPHSRTEPMDPAARRDGQYGGWFCAIGLMTGVPMGASHAIGHVLGSLYDVPHGLTSCVTLPAVLAFNYCADEPAFADVARALGGRAGHEAPDLLRAFIDGLGLPTRLGELGIESAAFPAIAAATMHEGWTATNPRPLRHADDILPLLEMML